MTSIHVANRREIIRAANSHEILFCLCPARVRRLRSMEDTGDTLSNHAGRTVQKRAHCQAIAWTELQAPMICSENVPRQSYSNYYPIFSMGVLFPSRRPHKIAAPTLNVPGSCCRWPSSISLINFGFNPILSNMQFCVHGLMGCIPIACCSRCFILPMASR